MVKTKGESTNKLKGMKYMKAIYRKKTWASSPIVFYVGKICTMAQLQKITNTIIQYHPQHGLLCAPPPQHLRNKKVLITPKYLSNVYSKSLSKKITPIFLGGDMQSFLDNNLP